jgi:hypothetical protein
MAIPEVGTDWISAGMDIRAPELLRRGSGVAVLCRDARGSATDLSPHNPDGSMRWSPFAQDMQMRDDLLLILKPNGFFTPNPEPNEGFINLGPFKDGDGPSWTTNVTNDRFMILQDIEPYDTEVTELTQPFSVTPVDTGTPWVQRLTDNNPFSDENGDSLIGDIGAENAVYARTSSSRNPLRQFLFFRVRFWEGKPIISCDVIPGSKWDDQGNSKMDKKDSEAAELTYLPVKDGRCMAMIDGIYQPVTRYRIWGGSGWAALGGYATFAADLPTGTPSTGAVSLTGPVPTGPNDPFEYGFQYTTDDGATWSEVVLDDTPTVSGGNVTVNGAVAAGAKKFRIAAKGTNGLWSYSPKSASVTIT